VEELPSPGGKGAGLGEAGEHVHLRGLRVYIPADLHRRPLGEPFTEEPQRREARDGKLRELPLRFRAEHRELRVVVREEVEVARTALHGDGDGRAAIFLLAVS
jgi:hypothetical protein